MGFDSSFQGRVVWFRRRLARWALRAKGWSWICKRQRPIIPSIPRNRPFQRNADAFGKMDCGPIRGFFFWGWCVFFCLFFSVDFVFGPSLKSILIPQQMLLMMIFSYRIVQTWCFWGVWSSGPIFFWTQGNRSNNHPTANWLNPTTVRKIIGWMAKSRRKWWGALLWTPHDTTPLREKLYKMKGIWFLYIL